MATCMSSIARYGHSAWTGRKLNKNTYVHFCILNACVDTAFGLTQQYAGDSTCTCTMYNVHVIVFS